MSEKPWPMVMVWKSGDNNMRYRRCVGPIVTHTIELPKNEALNHAQIDLFRRDPQALFDSFDVTDENNPTAPEVA